MKPRRPHGRARKQRRPRGIDWGGRWGGGSLTGGPTFTTFVASWKDTVVCGLGRWGGWSLAGGAALTTRSWPGGGRGARAYIVHSR